MIKARASGSKVYLYFMKKGRQARHRILRNSCLKELSSIVKESKERRIIVKLLPWSARLSGTVGRASFSRTRGPGFNTRPGHILSFLPLILAVVSCWQMYVDLILVDSLGGLSLPKKSVVRLTDHPKMSIAVYRGRKKTQQLPSSIHAISCELKSVR